MEIFKDNQHQHWEIKLKVYIIKNRIKKTAKVSDLVYKLKVHQNRLYLIMELNGLKAHFKFIIWKQLLIFIYLKAITYIYILKKCQCV